jgi:cytoskeletal protein RodZ
MDIGQTLRDARQRHGLTVQEISTATKISVRVLESIERNETDSLAGGLIIRGYLRAYASQVGLNPTLIVKEFRARHEMPEVNELRDLRVRYPDRPSIRARWSQVVMVLAGLALLAYSLYVSRSDSAVGTDPGVDTVPVIDDRAPSALPVTPARLDLGVWWPMA